jgi:hypothetical protein
MVGRGWCHHLHPENPTKPQVACALTGTSSPTHLAENQTASEISLAYVMEMVIPLGVASEGGVTVNFLELY